MKQRTEIEIDGYGGCVPDEMPRIEINTNATTFTSQGAAEQPQSAVLRRVDVESDESVQGCCVQPLYRPRALCSSQETPVLGKHRNRGRVV